MRSTHRAAGLVAGLILSACARQASVESTGDVAISSSPRPLTELPAVNVSHQALLG